MAGQCCRVHVSCVSNHVGRGLTWMGPPENQLIQLKITGMWCWAHEEGGAYHSWRPSPQEMHRPDGASLRPGLRTP